MSYLSVYISREEDLNSSDTFFLSCLDNVLSYGHVVAWCIIKENICVDIIVSISGCLSARCILREVDQDWLNIADEALIYL